jgi:hypothetical protein
MYSRISSAGCQYPSAFSGKLIDGFFKLILYGRYPFLPLKPTVTPAVVFDYQDDFFYIIKERHHL